MTTYYFDLETDVEGRNRPDPMKDKIVSIQYQPFWDDSGNPKNSLTVLKSWESSEKSILADFLEITGWNENPRRVWDFIPAGVNLGYDFLVIVTRCKELFNITIPLDFIMRDVPKFELKTILVIANRGKFKGSGLDHFSRKVSSGELASKVIREENWDALLTYIKQETEAFFELYQQLALNIPKIVKKV